MAAWGAVLTAGEHVSSGWAGRRFQVFKKIKIKIYIKLREDSANGKLLSTDAWQLADGIVSKLGAESCLWGKGLSLGTE